ncbi:MAG: hypothetical protein IT445_09470 [Phycisphaeraceae bacterium]|nr:hypothetical protein [Phycisphaeraceae bacterium]
MPSTSTGKSVGPTAGGAADGRIWAGAAKVDITNTEAGPVNDPLYVKALALRKAYTIVLVITVDAVAIGEIGHIGNDYLPLVSAQIKQELGVDPANILINASHCHGVVCSDVAQRTIRAVGEAWRKMEPVRVGVGVGYEDRITENRRLKMRDGKEADVRQAYALPPDDQIVGVGPVDPQIGILRLDREDGQTLAVVHHFACHPIMGVPNKGNTADISGFACKTIEENLNAGAMAFFLQGCCGDINPALYKDVDHPRDAEPLGHLLGLSTLRALKHIQGGENNDLRVIRDQIELPRADHAPRIAAMEAEQKRLLGSLKGTSLNLKTFFQLYLKYNIFDDYPSYYSYRYLHDRASGREGWDKLDADNRKILDHYLHNIHVMEELTRIQLNLDLLRKHHARNIASTEKTITVDVQGLRIGEFVLIAFPGELSAQCGLDIKKQSPHQYTFVSGVSNGYLYYTPTAEQMSNARAAGAQEDCECLVAPQWESLFKQKVAAILRKL